MRIATATPTLKTNRLTRLTGLIDKALHRFIPPSKEVPPVIHEAMRYSVFSGGKRFRPLLCLGACQAVGAPIRKALTVACAVEMIHTYSLIHDDLPAMDDANERRGQASCHRKFSEANAMLAGDALLTLAFELLGRNGMPNALSIIKTIGQASGTVGLIGGQVLDLQSISRSNTMTEEILTQIAQRKTGALITASVVAGALAGNASAAQIRLLKRYGQVVGLSFQLLDDVHDKEGFAQVLGAEQARINASRHVARGISVLKPFGRRAAVLRELAHWLEKS